MTDDTNDDSDPERIEIDDAEEGFLDVSETEDHPAVLRLTSKPETVHREEALDRAERWEQGKEVPAVVNFENPSDLRALLTDRRVELLESVMADPPDSIRGLADRLERDVKSVHDDLGVLAEYSIVQFERAGRAKQPYVPYDSIEISLEISSPPTGDDPATA